MNQIHALTRTFLDLGQLVLHGTTWTMDMVQLHIVLSLLRPRYFGQLSRRIWYFVCRGNISMKSLWPLVKGHTAETQGMQWKNPLVGLNYGGVCVYFPKSRHSSTRYCAGLDDSFPIMSYTHGNLWKQSLRWCTQIFGILVFSSRISVFCKSRQENYTRKFTLTLGWRPSKFTPTLGQRPNKGMSSAYKYTIHMVW